MVNPLSLIPGMSYVKLLGALAVGLIIWGAFSMVKSHFAQVEADRKALILAEVTIVQAQATIETQKEVARIQGQFAEDKAVLVDRYLEAKQDALNKQQEAVEYMGSATHMGEVAALKNEFSTGEERLTFRAQSATDKISLEIETLSKHEGLYAPNPDPSTNP